MHVISLLPAVCQVTSDFQLYTKIVVPTPSNLIPMTHSVLPLPHPSIGTYTPSSITSVLPSYIKSSATHSTNHGTYSSSIGHLLQFNRSPIDYQKTKIGASILTANSDHILQSQWAGQVPNQVRRRAMLVSMNQKLTTTYTFASWMLQTQIRLKR